MTDFAASPLEEALRTQQRRGWSDAELLARCLRFLRGSTLPDVLATRERTEAALADLPPTATDAERAELVAAALPLCWGPWGSYWLGDALVSGDLPQGPSRTPPRVPRAPREPGSWKTPLKIVLATWLVIVVLAVLVVVLG